MMKEYIEIITAFSPYSLNGLIHLFFILNERKLGRRITKIFIVPLLIFALGWMKGIENISKTQIAIFALHWLGDIFLIFSVKVCFYLGVFTFWLGDIFIAKRIYELISIKDYEIFLMVMSFFIPLYLYIVFIIFGKFMGNLRYLLFIFGLPLLAMNMMASILCLTEWSLMNILTAIGCLLFIFSDFTIVYINFLGRFKNQDFIIMITYMIAQGLICSKFSTL